MSSVRGHTDFRAVVRTSEPLAHNPHGAGSNDLSSKDFRPQLEQRHVLIRTDNMSVVSYINHQGGVRSNKHAANLLLCADRHFLSIRAAHIPSLLIPSLLNHCEAVKIQIIFRYMGKHLYKDRAVINNNCYRLIAFETAFENKERFMHSSLTFQCETKRIIQSKLRAGLQMFVCS